jgi:acetyl-CoA carboxylase carboxyltransferase component
MINNPTVLGGSMDVAAVEKMVRLIALCDTFHLPIVNFVSEPGFMVGLDSERRGMVRMAARACCAVGQSKIPWVTFIIQQAFGVAGALHTRTSGMRKHYAWPSASWGHMHIRGGAMAAFRRIIESDPDPKAKMEEIDLRLKAITSPFRTAEAFGVEDIIDPRDTRPLLCSFIKGAQRILKTQLGPSPAHRYLP